MKNAFDRLISRLDTAETIILELAPISTESSNQKGKKQTESKKKNKKQNIQGLGDNYRRCNTHVMGISEEEERERNRRHI